MYVRLIKYVYYMNIGRRNKLTAVFFFCSNKKKIQTINFT